MIIAGPRYTGLHNYPHFFLENTDPHSRNLRELAVVAQIASFVGLKLDMATFTLILFT